MDHAPTIALLAALTNLGLKPPQVSSGCPDDDVHLDETRELLGAVLPTSRARQNGAETVAREALAVVGGPPVWLLAAPGRRCPGP
jgi:hypothetical protein